MLKLYRHLVAMSKGGTFSTEAFEKLLEINAIGYYQGQGRSSRRAAR